MAIDTGRALYYRIKQGLENSSHQQNFGFFNFGTISYGDPTDVGQKDLLQSKAGFGVEMAGRPRTPAMPDFTKGISATGFYQPMEDGSLEFVTDEDAFGITGLTRPDYSVATDTGRMSYVNATEAQETYKNLDQKMTELGFMSPLEYSRAQPPLASTGFTTRTQGGRTLADVATSVPAAINPMLGAVSAALVSGDVYEGLGGRKETVPGGVAGLISDMNYENQWEAARGMNRGLPGYVTYVDSDGRLQSVQPASSFRSLFGVTHSAYGTNASIDKAKVDVGLNMMGLDPATFDLDTFTGQALDGFVPGFGGYTADGQFVNTEGEYAGFQNSGRSTLSYATAVADTYGTEYAVDLMNRQADSVAESGGFFSESRSNYYRGIADKVSQGVRDEYNFGTGKDKYTGGYVRSSSGQPVRSKTGFAYSGKKVEQQNSGSEPSSQQEPSSSSLGYDPDTGLT